GRGAYLWRFTLSEISRRVEMPERSGSPDLRARTNSTISCWLRLVGKPESRLKVSVTQPPASVAASAGVATCLYGTAVTYTSAPLTACPHVSVTWKRTENEVIPRVIGVELGTNWSTCRRAGAATSLTETACAPAASFGQPVCGAVTDTFAVAALTLELEPLEFEAVTLTRRVLPESPLATL